MRNTILRTSRKKVFVTTRAIWRFCGLTVLERNGNSERFTTYTTDDGLPSDNIRDVAIDVVMIDGNNREVAWLATDAGLVRLDHDLGSIGVITTAEGLSSNDCRSVFVDADHVKYIGVPGGMDSYRGL